MRDAASNPSSGASPPRSTAGNRGLLLALAALALLVSGPALARLELVEPMIGFAVFGLAGLTALVALVVNAVTWLRAQRRAARALCGAVVSLIPLAVFGGLFVVRPDVPPINDVTTDLDDPPVFVAAADRAGTEDADLSFPDAFREPIESAYGDLRSQHVAESCDDAIEAATSVARELGWRDIRRATWNDDVSLVEGVAVSALFRFHDDVVIRMRPVPDAGCTIDVRSRSRDGRSDLGINAERIRRVQAELRERLTPADSR